MEDARYIRQKDLIEREELLLQHITMIGLGAIGSSTALALGKMGVRQFMLFDPDDVGIENLAIQLFRNKDLGDPKVQAVWRRLMDEGDAPEVKAIAELFEGQPLPPDGPIIVGVDSLDARKTIWRMVPKKQTRLFIDARMGAEVAQIFAFDVTNRSERAQYAESLMGEPYQAPCTARGTVYCAFGIAAFITSYVKRWVMRQPFPFSWVFDFVNGVAYETDAQGIHLNHSAFTR